ncbi:MAG: PEP-CTERM sorting domain-containing protein [Akkermansiaceae bacterium]
MKAKISILSFFVFSAVTAQAAITVRVTNVVDFDSTTSAIVDNTGTVLTNGSGFVAVGSFDGLDDSQIQAAFAGGNLDSAFTELAATTINLGDGLWDFAANAAGDTSAFTAKSMFTVVANGNTLASSDQFFVYRHSSVNGTGNFNEAPSNNDDAVTAIGLRGTGSIVIGGHDNFQFDFGAGNQSAFNLVAVPEPSSTALLGLGGLAFVLRRRR